MHDPFPIPPGPVNALSAPLAQRLNLQTLPLHIHEILLFFLFYTGVHSFSPAISTLLAPRVYPALPARSRLSWDVHVVSFTQSVLIDGMAAWLMWADRDSRAATSGAERVWGYSGAEGLIQAMAAGYFMWDLVVTARNVHIFGPGMLAHASSALAVYVLGFVGPLPRARRGRRLT